MTDPPRILLASDLSARSAPALERALMLAREWRARLLIGHALEGEAPDGDGAPTAETLRAGLPPEAAGAELVVRPGPAPQVLAALAAETGSDLVVTGVGRYDSVGDYFLGTTVDHIVRHAGVPVLVVRERPSSSYRGLLVATDFSDCALAALLAAGHLFAALAIRLVHAFQVPFEGWLKSDGVREEVAESEEERMAAFLAHPAIGPALRERVTALVERGEPGAVIDRQLGRSGADLLVLGTHGRGGFARAVIGSTAEALLASARTDVLMVRARKDAKAG